MRRMALLCLLLLPLAQAGPGHTASPVDATMPIHFLDDGSIALNPAMPTGDYVGEDALACEPLTWQAGFSRSLDKWQPELARSAAMKGAVDLAWYVDFVVPGTDVSRDPLLPLHMTAQLRSGSDLTTMGDGQLLTEFSDQVAPVAVGDVYELAARMQWASDPILPEQGLQLEITLGLSGDCQAAPGIRAVSQDGARPELVWKIYDPVRIDALEVVPIDDDVHFILHASSPWGRDFILGGAPQVTGNDGLPQGTTLLNEEPGLALMQTWTWTPEANGTYRVDAMVAALDNSTVVADQAIFKFGDREIMLMDPAPEPTKESPGFALPILVMALLGLARNANIGRNRKN